MPSYKWEGMNTLNKLAVELNEKISSGNSHVLDSLSNLGKALYFPKGIISQSTEAKQKAHRFNATTGIATEGEEPMYLPSIQKNLSAYDPKDLYPYAPPAGKLELRQAWKEKMLAENPSLEGKNIGQPIVTNALTHGLSIVADLFCDEGDIIVIPEKLWGNYRLTFEVRQGAKIVTYPLFNEQGTFNHEGLRETLLAHKPKGKAVVILNFPNNPTGYTPSVEEGDLITQTIKEVAEEGMNIVAVTDDAYFGLFFEDSMKESLFGKLADVHPRVLAVKIDGATKEEFVWGFRVGFITYASTSDAVLEALEKKTMGCIRGTISNCPHPSQTFVLEALRDPNFKKETQEKFEILKGRANKVKEVLDNTEKYKEVWEYYPFNSGYFMCLKLNDVDAEELRVHLLDQYGVGTISINQTDLRIAFSCVEEEDVEEIFELVYQGVCDLRG